MYLKHHKTLLCLFVYYYKSIFCSLAGQPVVWNTFYILDRIQIRKGSHVYIHSFLGFHWMWGPLMVASKRGGVYLNYSGSIFLWPQWNFFVYWLESIPRSNDDYCLANLLFKEVQVKGVVKYETPKFFNFAFHCYL